MKTKTLKIFLALTVLGLIGEGAFIFYSEWKENHSAKTETVSAKKDDGIAYYHCAMHPQVTSSHPDKCPICKMDLTPVYKGTNLGDGIVQIDPAMVQNIGVKTEVVLKHDLTHIIRTTGIVDYDETKQYDITTKFSGYIENLYVDYIGKPVQYGQPLFEIFSADLVAAQQEYLTALSYKKSMSSSNDASVISGADAMIQSAKKKLLYWDISNAQINTLEQTGEIKKSLTIYSPHSGVVIEKNVFDGMQVQAGMNLFKLADISKMWVYADVYANELSLVKVGEPVELELPYHNGKTLQGKISYIAPFMQDQSRTAKVRIEFSNANSDLKKDMYVTVNIQPEDSLNVIAVPEQAVIHSGTRDVIVLSLGGGRFKSVEVQLGSLANNFYEVLSGLNEGDTIVTSSQFLIDSESSLKAGLSGMQNMNMGSSNKKQDAPMQNMNNTNVQPTMKKDSVKTVTKKVDIPKKPTSVVYWCPMDTDVVSDKPGTCPVCGMDLEIKK